MAFSKLQSVVLLMAIALISACGGKVVQPDVAAGSIGKLK